MLEPKSSSLMPSAWAVSLLWEVTMPMTITATGKMTIWLLLDGGMDHSERHYSRVDFNM